MVNIPFKQWLGAGCGAVLLFWVTSVEARNLPAVPKWQRFELTLRSSVAYSNAFQQAEVRALFVSPTGRTNRVYGFWDGGRVWRVRFQPDFPGRWTYYTLCSDAENSGLHGQSGEFLCTAAGRADRFQQHGPIQVARPEQHLEHADRTPFLWLGDVAWDAATRATGVDWHTYLTTRSNQNFTVVQWRLPLPTAIRSNAAFTGHDQINLNLNFFRRLDAKVTAANRAGLLNAIAPLWEINSAPEIQLPEDQAIKLYRYALARWGADQVAWLVAFETDSTGAAASRWQRIGREVFGPVTHAPVAILPGDSLWVLDALRQESWVNIVGLPTTQVTEAQSLPWLLNGPPTSERFKTPLRPVVAMLPAPEVADQPERDQITGEFSRRLSWWNLLINAPAGVSYQADAVSRWDATRLMPRSAPAWREALNLPGAQALAPLATTFGPREFWQLTPMTDLRSRPSDLSQPQQRIAAASLESSPFTVIYLPEAGGLNLDSVSAELLRQAEWLNPRTGERTKALPAPTGATHFHPPGTNDWVLLLPAGN
jgi:hypothetical protein